MRFVFCYFAIAATLAFVLVFFGPYDSYTKLSAGGDSAEATIVEPICWDHGSFIYTFQANGATIKSRDHSATIQRNCEALRTNDKITITYWPQDPSVHTTGNPARQLEDEKSSIQKAVVLWPIGIIFFVTYLRRANEQEKAKS